MLSLFSLKSVCGGGKEKEPKDAYTGQLNFVQRSSMISVSGM